MMFPVQQFDYTVTPEQLARAGRRFGLGQDEEVAPVEDAGEEYSHPFVDLFAPYVPPAEGDIVYVPPAGAVAEQLQPTQVGERLYIPPSPAAGYYRNGPDGDIMYVPLAAAAVARPAWEYLPPVTVNPPPQTREDAREMLATGSGTPEQLAAANRLWYGTSSVATSAPISPAAAPAIRPPSPTAASYMGAPQTLSTVWGPVQVPTPGTDSDLRAAEQVARDLGVNLVCGRESVDGPFPYQQDVCRVPGSYVTYDAALVAASPRSFAGDILRAGGQVSNVAQVYGAAPTVAAAASSTDASIRGRLLAAGGSQPLTADQWNYYYSQITGIAQTVDLFPPGNRGLLMTVDDYLARRVAAGITTVVPNPPATSTSAQTAGTTVSGSGGSQTSRESMSQQGQQKLQQQLQQEQLPLEEGMGMMPILLLGGAAIIAFMAFKGGK